MLTQKKKIKFVYIILISFFLGFLGVDRYLMGYKNWWIKAITLGGGTIWALLDLINILTLKLKMADGSEFE